MAAAIKALNARIRANPVTDYLCSTRESHTGEEEVHLRSQLHKAGRKEQDILLGSRWRNTWVEGSNG